MKRQRVLKSVLSVLLALALVLTANVTALTSYAVNIAQDIKTIADVPADLTGKTVILHTNDIHGAIMGYAQVAAVKAEYEAKGATVILVDAGDYSQGTTYVSTNKGAAAVTMMNAAGYDYATLGNHEFDFGYAQLVENMKSAEFKPIVADVLLKETGKSIFDGHAIEEVDGVKIGFFGMETPETFTKVNPGLIQEITFPQGTEMYACAQTEVDALKEAGADIIIGLVHLGVDAESEPNRSIDLYNNVTGIDFLIDGHSHTVMTEGPDGAPIQSTGTKASKTSLMNVGLIQIDNASKKIEKNELIPITEESAKDAAVAAKAQEIMDAVDAEYGKVFAKSEVELNGDKAPNGNRDSETNLGDLITDAMKWGVLKEGGLEVPDENVVAITNGGGIRAWIHKGDVTKNDVNTVLPFGNTVAVVYVKGSELLEALEASTYSTPGPVGGFPQVSGIKFNIDVNKEYDKGEQYPDSTYYGPASIQRVSIDNVNGKPFDKDATYAVVTNNFCAAGGDTYYAFKAASSQFDTGLPMDEVLMDYITTERVDIHYEMPLNEVIYDFFDALKSKTKGYGSLDYEFVRYEKSNLVKLDVLLNKEMVDAFSMIVHESNAYARGRFVCEKLKEIIPMHQFEVPIQAAIGQKVIARETVKAYRKDVIAKCYGGDISRKKKLLEKQKEGKKRMRQFGKVEVPQEAFTAVLKYDDNK